VNAVGTPTRAVWLSVTVAAALALPSLYSPTAYGAVTASTVIGITPAYAIPIYLRLRAGRRFQPGPWNLGRWSLPIGWTAVAWVAFVTVLFCLPQSSPVTAHSMNYAAVALVVVLVLAAAWWKIVGRRSYEIPASGGSKDMADLGREVV
jgi:hypothetical protein